MDRRPPLPASPRRLRPRHAAKPDARCKTPPSAAPARSLQVQEHRPMLVDDDHLLRADYQAISSQLQALARKAREQFGQSEGTPSPSRAGNAAALFERGRMYELYAARRDERLRRRKGEKEAEEGKRPPWGLGVCSAAVGVKKAPKRPEAARRSVDSSAVTARKSYSLRSSVKCGKEVKEAAALFATPAKAAAAPASTLRTRSSRRNLR